MFIYRNNTWGRLLKINNKVIGGKVKKTPIGVIIFVILFALLNAGYFLNVIPSLVIFILAMVVVFLAMLLSFYYLNSIIWEIGE